MRVRAGAAAVDVTPPAGLAMSGFAARTAPAEGAHDALTVRALVVEDTALLIADVIGLDAAFCAGVAARSGFREDRLVIAALHTHGGPVSMQGRLGKGLDEGFLGRLEAACVSALEQAARARRPATMLAGSGTAHVARNRRSANGPVDREVTVVALREAAGGWLAVLVSHACHPVVLGPGNRLWTADYPHYARRTLEAAFPGAVCLFATGCAGDVNTGHGAHASLSLAADAARSFEAAERAGEAVAQAALAARLAWVAGARAGGVRREVALPLARGVEEDPPALARAWKAERAAADAARRALLDLWIEWAETRAQAPLAPQRVPVTALSWGELCVVGLPGEMFAGSALALRRQAGRPLLLVGYAGDNPGYIPPREAYAAGGYEVCEAHRYYGMPAAFAPGGAEAVERVALDGIAELYG